jgi:hypothetical protein
VPPVLPPRTLGYRGPQMDLAEPYRKSSWNSKETNRIEVIARQKEDFYIFYFNNYNFK